MDWNKFWQDTWNTIKNFFIDKGWAILGFFAALIVVKVLIKICRKLFAKTKLDKIAQKFLLSIIKFCLWLIYVIVLLSILGISITGIVAALSAAVLAIGLALQNSLSNVANGIIIVSSKIFHEGDYVSVGGVEGTVKNINLLATTIVTNDNKAITIPNSTIVNNAMTNFSAQKTRRVDLTFDLAYEADIAKAKKVIFSVVESEGRIYKDPAPFCMLSLLGASSIQLVLRVWVDKEDYWDVYFYLMETIFNELKRNNISIPYNQLEVRMRTDKVKLPFDKAPLKKRVDKERKEEKEHHLFDIKKLEQKNQKKQTNQKLEQKKAKKTS